MLGAVAYRGDRVLQVARDKVVVATEPTVRPGQLRRRRHGSADNRAAVVDE